MVAHFPPRRILVAMDFSPAAMSALVAAEALRTLFHARLEVLCVQEPDAIASGLEMPDAVALGVAAHQQEWRMAQTRLRLAEVAGKMRTRAVSSVLLGPPADVLSRQAAPPCADMVVMGIHDSRGVGSAIFGSVAEAVVRRARVPVLTVHRRRGPLKLRRLLCPVSLTPHSGRVLAYAARLAKTLGATLCALYVFSEGMEDDACRALEGFLRLTLGEEARMVEPLVLRGTPREQIVLQAERGSFDLLVLCEHLRPWSADRLLGSTAERALRRASIPVLALPYDAPSPRKHPHWLTQARQVLRRPHIL